ncbi:MAG: hypothetical protein IJ475_00225 [Bacilli bacterium]|nr:hypothetical protein [Bacilli bacterium]
MGIFDKLKNILFEDEEEVESLPVYSSKEEKEEVKTVVRKESSSISDEPISTSDSTRFRNVKRDIDLYSVEDDVLSEVPDTPVLPKTPEVKPEPVMPKEEPKTVFQSFDEDEFERLNSRIASNENKARRDAKIREEASFNQARRANNNFSATSAPVNRERDVRDPNRYKLDFEPAGKKPFKPSPVISPVYGILDKNYSKDDIVDKKDGMKRERIKPIITRTQDIPSRAEEPEVVEVNIDDVRKKAFGAIDFLERESKRYIEPEVKEDDIPKINEEDVLSTPTFEEEILHDLEKMDEIVPELSDEVIVDEVEETPIIEEELISDEISDDSTILDDEDDYITSIEEQLEDENSNYEDVSILDEEVKPEKIDRTHIMDDMEKTSTLQILDDIERELNSIKPMTTSYEDEEDDERARLERNETLENDLFNLIDSMYEEGEEEDND